MRQLITPTPYIPCQPGWCLQYVRQAFGLPARYATATDAWEASTSKHRDRNFPPGLWVPVWYGLADEPAGHVVLRAPDGSVYSTSDLSTTPHHHPDLADLEDYYAYYGMTLTYRGWTEDVAGYPVLTKETFMALTDAQQLKLLQDVAFIKSELENINTAGGKKVRFRDFFVQGVRAAQESRDILKAKP
jgi:hypothetical protein